MKRRVTSLSLLAALAPWGSLAMCAEVLPELTGVVHGSYHGSALFGTSGTHAGWRREGDAVGACELNTVGLDHVLLRCPSGMQRIHLHETRRMTQALDERATEALHVVTDIAPLRSLFQDWQALVNRISLEPVSADGVLHAWRLQYLDTESPLGELNLAPGDLITAVNDIPIAQTDAVIRALRHADEQGGIRLSVERDGHPLVIQTQWRSQVQP